MVGCMALVKEFNNDISISFGLDYCDILIIVNGKPVENNALYGFPRPLHDKGYKYLVILESLDFCTKQVKYNVTKEYISQLH
eukprot:7779187-Ditylum_brightwellii.AAC.1